MTPFASLLLTSAPIVTAPDGSQVRVLLQLSGGSMAHFTLEPGRVSLAVAHRTVSEIWYILSGAGEMWRKQGDAEEVTSLNSGLCLTIPVGAHFQFRASPTEPLRAVAITMPPWPGNDEAILVPGKWPA